MTQSLVSFIRKQLKVKGKSEHSGRGFWVCSVDVSYEELLKRVKDKAHEWSGQNLIKEELITEDGVELRFNPEAFDPFYCGFRLNRDTFGWLNGYTVFFTVPKNC